MPCNGCIDYRTHTNIMYIHSLKHTHTFSPSLSLSLSLSLFLPPPPPPPPCREVQSYHTYRPAVTLAMSHRGLLALGRGRVVEVWRDVMGEGGGERQKAPYLTHKLKGEATGVEFCPFEDSLGIGHGNGFTSIIVPGTYVCL